MDLSVYVTAPAAPSADLTPLEGWSILPPVQADDLVALADSLNRPGEVVFIDSAAA